MPKVRSIIFLILIVGALWHFYGETFNQSGFQGVYEDMRSDVIEIKENPKVIQTVEFINNEIQLLLNKLKDNVDETKEPSQPTPDKPELDGPSKQSFSVHNIELGDDRSKVEQQAGQPKRTSLNEYGVNWVAYHENYHNFFMTAYNDDNEVIGLYTNQDLLTSTQGITFNSTRDSVLSMLNEPLKSIRKGFVNYQIENNQEYNTFHIDNNYVTVFFDKHENLTVTAIQIISEELEQQKEAYFAEANEELKAGFEYQLFDLTNAARVNHNLSVLSWDESVRITARDHSKDMADNNYFGHTNLEGQSPFDRMTEDNITYRMAGENLAAGQPSSIFAHEGLMNSIGHRENKLHSDFEALAVGVAFNEESQPYYTENYLTK
ncbi:CAP domain-containing protein [Aquibacillus rhizosphaerae]|uniref:CAP-associated domain-containing protein n=1 Tax=Aquibacillus rhizosphaerae TaxID=3051431 RepID=A0ABT7LBD4_9BACI|nr:CAP-associated domain-containing protein [Aquibacillus sp. LR5S19]MDL4843183.1 CAP-associated domain-containing protein [Aquibacillus sp. LR5S19]